MKGAYILLLRSSGVSLRVGALGIVELPEGVLAYVGSARGPGGLGARVKRHFRKGKVLRWHIDYLTEELDVPCALALPGEDESHLSNILKSVGRPLAKGFGCSDRREDYTHLYFLGDDIRHSLMNLYGILGGKRAYLIRNPHQN